MTLQSLPRIGLGILKFKSEVRPILKRFIRTSSNVRVGDYYPQNFRVFRQVSVVVPPIQKEFGFEDTYVPEHFSEVYSDFLPDPRYEFRNRLREQIEREDMIARRLAMDIPEFYVGSIMAVTIADQNATGKINRFVGICIQRGDHSLRSYFILRNIVDNLGVEIKYEMYCPLIKEIEVLRLEKRIDSDLTYLRDCLPEYSTFSFDMDPEPLVDGIPVPINYTKAVLKARPWHERWERRTDLLGLQLPTLRVHLGILAKKSERPWEKYDLMKEYRLSITREEMAHIYKQLAPVMPKFEAARRKLKKLKVQKETL